MSDSPESGNSEADRALAKEARLPLTGWQQEVFTELIQDFLVSNKFYGQTKPKLAL